jgi:hypothetical protein
MPGSGSARTRDWNGSCRPADKSGRPPPAAAAEQPNGRMYAPNPWFGRPTTDWTVQRRMDAGSSRPNPWFGRPIPE